MTKRSATAATVAAAALLLPLALLRPGSGAQTAPNTPQPLPNFTVVVDPGHGGQDTGAVGLDGTLEKDLDLSIAEKLRDTLTKQGVRVIMTRTSDTSLPTMTRPGFVAADHAQYFVSIHCDSRGSANANSGVEVYYHGGQMQERRLASDIFTHVTRAAHLPAFGPLSDKTRFLQGFGVLRGSPVPSVLVECGYMNNARDLAALHQERTQQQVADGIAAGLEQFASNQTRAGANAAVPAVSAVSGDLRPVARALSSADTVPTVKSDPAAVQLLIRMTEAYRALQTYSGTEVAEGDGALGMPYRLDLSYARPGKLAFTHARSFGPQTITHHILLDGRTLFETSSSDAPGRYARLTIPETNYTLWQEALIIRCDVKFPITVQLLEDDDDDAMFKNLDTDPHLNVHLGPPGRMDGVAVDTVTLTSHGPNGDGTRVMWIGRDDHLLRQITETTGSGPNQPPMKTTQTFSHVQANPVLPASTFVFTPAPGAVAVDVDPGGAHADPAAVSLMDQMYAASAALKSFSCTFDSEATGVNTASGKAYRFPETHETIALRKPGQVAMMRKDSVGEARAVANGTNLYVTTTESSGSTQALPGRYLKLGIGPDDPNRLVWLSRFGNLPQYIPDEDLIPGVILGWQTRPADGYDWKMGNSGVVDGEPVDTVTLRIDEGTGTRYDLLTLAISRRDHLLRQVSEAQKDAHQPLYSRVETYTDIQKNPALPASLFVFTPPPGSVAVATTGELFGKR